MVLQCVAFRWKNEQQEQEDVPSVSLKWRRLVSSRTAAGLKVASECMSHDFRSAYVAQCSSLIADNYCAAALSSLLFSTEQTGLKNATGLDGPEFLASPARNLLVDRNLLVERINLVERIILVSSRSSRTLCVVVDGK